jgi:hypothetical protein
MAMGKWKRVSSRPIAAIDTRLDPYCSQVYRLSMLTTPRAIVAAGCVVCLTLVGREIFPRYYERTATPSPRLGTRAPEKSSRKRQQRKRS